MEENPNAEHRHSWTVWSDGDWFPIFSNVTQEEAESVIAVNPHVLYASCDYCSQTLNG